MHFTGHQPSNGPPGESKGDPIQADLQTHCHSLGLLEHMRERKESIYLDHQAVDIHWELLSTVPSGNIKGDSIQAGLHNQSFCSLSLLSFDADERCLHLPILAPAKLNPCLCKQLKHHTFKKKKTVQMQAISIAFLGRAVGLPK